MDIMLSAEAALHTAAAKGGDVVVSAKPFTESASSTIV